MSSMFKKKSPVNIQAYPRQSKPDQKIYGIQAKLESMIKNGSRSMIFREKQNRSKGYPGIQEHSGQRERPYLQQTPQTSSELVQSKQGRTNMVKKGQQKKPASFESQLKGLIKIIYQKEKQIQRLKQTIKSTSIHTLSPPIAHGSQPSQSHLGENYIDQFGLNVQDIKQTTKRIIQMEGKQEELHQVIDFLVKKEEEAAKTIKQLTEVNKSLQQAERQLKRKNQESTKKNEELKWNNQELIRKNQELMKNKEEMGELSEKLEREECIMQQQQAKLKLKDQEILRLNSDLLTVIQQASQREQELHKNIVSLQKTLEQTTCQNSDQLDTQQILREKQLLEAIEQTKRQYEEQVQGLEYEIGNLRVIEEECKQTIREQQEIIEQMECRAVKDKNQWKSKKEKWQLTISSKDEEVDRLNIKIHELTKQTDYLTQQINQLTQEVSCPQPPNTCTIPTHIDLMSQHQLTKSTIAQYKRLLEQLKHDMNEQQIAHQQETARLESELMNNQKRYMESDQARAQLEQRLVIEANRLSQKIQSNKVEYQIIMKRQAGEISEIKSVYEAQLKELRQAKSESEEQIKNLKTMNLQLHTNLEQKLTHNQSLSTQLSSAQQQIFALSQTSQTLLTQKYSHQHEVMTLMRQIKDLQQKTVTLQEQIFHYQQNLATLQASQRPKTTQLLSLPTIGNLSCIDLADSSFECKLEQLNTKRGTEERPGHSGDEVGHQRSVIEEHSSYLRYQENLLQQLERQCNEPTELFLQQDENRTKLVELSEVRQSLKMTKEVNFQLFEEINRQQKIILEFKSSLRSFIQAHKANNKSLLVLDKLQDLLLIK